MPLKANPTILVYSAVLIRITMILPFLWLELERAITALDAVDAGKYQAEELSLRKVLNLEMDDVRAHKLDGHPADEPFGPMRNYCLTESTVIIDSGHLKTTVFGHSKLRDGDISICVDSVEGLIRSARGRLILHIALAL